jgi:hypothetical protein
MRAHRKHIETYNSVDEMDDEEDVTSWDGGDDDDDEPDQMVLDEDEDDSVDESSEDDEPKSLIVCLRYRKGAKLSSNNAATTQQDAPMPDIPDKPEPGPKSETVAEAMTNIKPEDTHTDDSVQGPREIITEEHTLMESKTERDAGASANGEPNPIYPDTHSNINSTLPFQPTLAPPTPAST